MGLDLKKAINKSLKATLKMKIEPRIKERMLHHINQTFLKINSLYNLNIKKERFCKECKEKIEDWEHILYSCPISKQILEVTCLHLNNTFNISLPENITKYFLPLSDVLDNTNINDEEKMDAATLIALTISNNHARYFNQDKKLAIESNEQITKVVNSNILKLIMRNQKTKLKK